MDYIEAESYNMSTITEQRVQNSAEADDAILEVKEELVNLERKMSFYLKHSEISKLNESSGNKSLKVSADTFKVIEKSIEYSKLTNGVFDITLAPVIAEWGIFSENEKIPEENRLNKLMNLVGYQDILLNKEQHTIFLKREGQKVDLGGIAKGYATDQAIEIYKKHGIKSAMINLGGNVAVLGKKTDNTPWVIGIQNPDMERGEMVCAVSSEDISIVTSGNYVRNFEAAGEVYGHILSTTTGKPIKNLFLSVTVICKSGIKADALSTAIFQMGLDDAIEFININNDIGAILITDCKEVYVSRNLKEKFHIIDEDFEYYYC